MTIRFKTVRIFIFSFTSHEHADGIRFVTSAKMPEKKSSGPAFVFKLWKPLTHDMNPKFVLSEKMKIKKIKIF
jgi:hypothetical protein